MSPVSALSVVGKKVDDTLLAVTMATQSLVHKFVTNVGIIMIRSLYKELYQDCILSFKFVSYENVCFANSIYM